MFLEFYKLKCDPFGVTPDPCFLFPTTTHREALASLLYGIQAGRGFLALIARPGMGKTTLLFRLLEHLRESARTVFLFQTVCDPVDLMRYLLQDLGADTPGQDMVSMHKELNQILLHEANAGRRLVLIIDEAQNLSEPVLETTRLLSDFETPTSKLMQIVLAGQPELAAKLDRPSLSQLRQRISIFARLEPFTPAETFSYIEYRLGVAGRHGFPIFTRPALDLIAEHSEGIPRKINNLCFNSLSLGFALEQATIGPHIVREVLADLCISSLAPKSPPARLSDQLNEALARFRAAKQGSVSPLPEQKPPAYEAQPAEPHPTDIAFGKGIWPVDSPVPRVPAASPAYAVPPAPPPARDIPLVERIHWPASSLVLNGPPGARFPPREPRVHAESSVEPPAREIPFAKPVLPAEPQVPATSAAHRWFLPKAGSALVLLAFLLTLYVSTKLWLSQSEAESSNNSAILASSKPAHPSPLVEPVVHVVQQDETLEKIARSYFGYSNAALLTEIAKLNPAMTNPDQLQIGQRILLPNKIFSAAAPAK
jgi:type II secretory pathway predicted ATPase ExeA